MLKMLKVLVRSLLCLFLLQPILVIDVPASSTSEEIVHVLGNIHNQLSTCSIWFTLISCLRHLVTSLYWTSPSAQSASTWLFRSGKILS